MPSLRGKPSRTSLIAFVLILSPVLYVLSYAPVFRLAGNEPTFLAFGVVTYSPREGWQELYQPVEWLTDRTPLREPLLDWAGLWGEGVEQDMRLRSERRIAGKDPYGTSMIINFGE